MTSKPINYIETNHLTEIKDRTEMANHIWNMFRDLYGICYSNIGVDERTGEIYDRHNEENE